VLPILHLNGWKIANPAVLARIGDDELDALLRGYGYEPVYVSGHEPAAMHQDMAAALDGAIARIHAIQSESVAQRRGADQPSPRWPMIVLRSPKGWTGPAQVDGLPVEGTWRAHQVPLAEVRTNPAHLRQLEQWMRSYRPGELFDADGRPRPELLTLVPPGDRRLGASPHANGDRFHLVMDVIDRVPGLANSAAWLRQDMVDTRARHHAWVREHGEDLPEVQNWVWPGTAGQ
jgi:xylulose-5-phosphate/fructose-6-phosphate phosphoketolase